MPGFFSFIPRLIAALPLLPFAFVFSGCDLVWDGSAQTSLLEVEYRVIALEQDGRTRVHGIFFVDADGREVTQTKVTLPWSYKGEYEAESRIALAVAQQALGEGYGSATLQIFRDGGLSTEMIVDAPRGSGTSVTGYDSDPAGDPWAGP